MQKRKRIQSVPDKVTETLSGWFLKKIIIKEVTE